MNVALACRAGLLIPVCLRWAHRAYAGLTGFFWVPCPLCGKPFGGHEWRDIGGKSSGIPNGTPVGFTGICPDCTRAGLGDSGQYLARQEGIS